LLTDRNGLEIPLRDRGHLQIQVLAPQVTLVPDGEEVSSAASQGEIRVTAPPLFQWSVKNAPAWMTIGEGAGGAGDGTISWRSAANTSRKARSATLEIGDATFEIAQLPEKEGVPSFAPAGSGILPTGYAQNAPASPNIAKVTLDRKTVRLGEEIQIGADQIPAGWSGEITVNSRRTFKIDASNHTLRATLRNGFNERGPTSFYVQLFDLHGKEIPLPNNGLFSMEVTPTVITLDRDSRSAEADGAPKE